MVESWVSFSQGSGACQRLVACANSVPLAPAGREAPQSPKALQAGAGATGIAVVAAVFQQWLRAGEQAAFAASDQPQPPIEHRFRGWAG